MSVALDERGGCVREAVRRHLQDDVRLSEEEAVDAEVGIYNWALHTADARGIAKSWHQPAFAAVYASKSKSVLANLDPSSFVGNADLAQRMRRREFAPHSVAFMSPSRVFPERWKSVLESKAERDNFVYNEKPTAMTDQYKCGACKQRSCVYRELQLRSCDEPVTLFITCLKCGNNWRIG